MNSKDVIGIGLTNDIHGAIQKAMEAWVVEKASMDDVIKMTLSALVTNATMMIGTFHMHSSLTVEQWVDGAEHQLKAIAGALHLVGEDTIQ